MEFGSAPLDRAVSLMRTGRDKTGRWVFLGENPATEHRDARSCLWTDKTGAERRATWWELRVTVSSNSKEVQPGHSLVLAEFPWSRAQVDVAAFKRPSKKGGAQRLQPPERTLANESELLAWIAARPNDFWEKGSRLTAAVSRPTPLQDGSAGLRAGREPLAVFGVCAEPLDAAVDELYASAESKDLLHRLKTDSLAFWPRVAAANMQQLPKGAYPEVKAMAPMLMALALKLALAGPVEDSERWIGQPVMKLADAVFRNLINLHNRRVHSRRAHEGTGVMEDAAEDAEWLTEGDWG